MKRTGAACVYVDITHRGPEFIRRTKLVFPIIESTLIISPDLNFNAGFFTQESRDLCHQAVTVFSIKIFKYHYKI